MVRRDGRGSKQNVTVAFVSAHTLAASGIEAVLRGRTDFQPVLLNFGDLAKENLLKMLGVRLAVVDLPSRELRRKKTMETLAYLAGKTRVILLLDQDDCPCLPVLLKAPIAACLLKDCALEKLLQTIESVAHSKKLVNARARGLIAEGCMHPFASPCAEELKSLSQQEIKVLELIGQGLSNKDIGGALHISVRTVENHRLAVTKKLGKKSTADLVKFAIEHCLTTY